jgi:hypothetical protein
MKAELWIHVRHFDREIRLKKELDVPFVPQRGLKIVLDVISTDHPNSAAFHQALESPMLVTGIFEVDSVLYFADQGRLRSTPIWAMRRQVTWTSRRGSSSWDMA